jgi:hypothetical protein
MPAIVAQMEAVAPDLVSRMRRMRAKTAQIMSGEKIDVYSAWEKAASGEEGFREPPLRSAEEGMKRANQSSITYSDGNKTWNIPLTDIPEFIKTHPKAKRAK